MSHWTHAKAILQQVTVGQLVIDEPFFLSVASNQTLDEALTIMQSHHVTSLPVSDADAKDDEPNWVGVIDILDILALVVFSKLQGDQLPDPSTLQGLDLREFSVKTVIGLGDQVELNRWSDGLFVIDSDNSLWDLVGMIQGGVKRVLVKIGDSGYYKNLSQVDVLRYLALHEEKLDSDETIESAGLLHQTEFNELCTIRGDECALLAFRKMLLHKADAVAVVKDDGTLLTTLSASDLRFAYQFDETLDASSLLLSTTMFLKKIHHQDTLRVPLTVRQSDPVKLAVRLCLLGHVHRVWVVDSTNIPNGCVRVQDMIESIIRIHQ